jgi:L-2-hydroxyglutarate oxidase
VEALRRLVPEIRGSDLVTDGSEVRTQAVRRDGSLLDDFEFVREKNMLHVWNVPSATATACLSIGREILRMAGEAFSLEMQKATI